jgi:DNA-binding beta-propeller fold protein YncE
LDSSLDRRALLLGASATAISALAAACAPAQPTVPTPAFVAKPTQASPTTAAATTALTSPEPETVYVFNVGSKDVTLIDAASRQARETKPLGAQVRWLSNQQTFWDGSRVWTYDFPNNRLQAIAIDPKAVAVTTSIDEIGTGPGHSLVVLPGGRRAAVNVAGDNVIALLDLPTGSVEGTIATGAFP